MSVYLSHFLFFFFIQPNWLSLCSQEPSTIVTLKSFNLLGTLSTLLVVWFPYTSWRRHSLENASPGHNIRYIPGKGTIIVWKSWQKLPHIYLCTWCVPQCKSPRHNRTNGANVHACTCLYQPPLLSRPPSRGCGLWLWNRTHASFRLVPEIVGAIAKPVQKLSKIHCYRLWVTAGGNSHRHRTTNQFESPEPARRSSILLHGSMLLHLGIATNSTQPCKLVNRVSMNIVQGILFFV